MGVDVFFVISGFLITGIIKKEIENNDFSYLTFWGRRARRILPASILMMLITLFAAWFILLPADYDELAKSTLYQVGFAGNVFFANTSGYFAGPSELKPLLHTWSLAVEEQYYLFFPAVYLLLCRYMLSVRLAVLTLIALVSLGYSQYLVVVDGSKAYYLLHSRAWEMIVGGLVAHISVGTTKSLRVTNIVSILALSGILFTIAYYTRATPFPGVNAILPVICTGLLLWANTNPNTIVNRLLSMRILVAIGLLSYSLYLWHWPIIAFTRYIVSNDLTITLQLFIIGLSFLIAWCSWRFVEAPFRKRSLFPKNKHILLAALLGLVAVAACAQIIRGRDGFPNRLPEAAQIYANASKYSKEQRQCAHLSDKRLQKGNLCILGNTEIKPNILHWGDSHAEGLYPTFKRALINSEKSVLHASRSGCIPLPGAELYKGKDCENFNAAMLELLSQGLVEHLVISANWSTYIYGDVHGDVGAVLTMDESEERSSSDAKEIFLKHINKLHAKVSSFGVKLWLMKPLPEHDVHISNTLTMLTVKKQTVDHVGLSLSEYQSRNRFILDVFKDLEMNGANTLKPIPILCADGFCAGAQNGFSLYKDDDHISIYGAKQLAPILNDLLSLN